MPVAPPANVAVKVAMSSLSTASRISLTGTPPACPTAAPSGSGRSGTTVASTVPRTLSTGPHRNSPTSTRCVPMSASAPDPGPPWYRQLIGASAVEAVVAPVVAVEVRHRAEGARGDLLADRADGGGPAEREADRGHPVRLGRPGRPWPARPPPTARAASRTARACPRPAGPRRSRGAARSPPRR